MNKEKIHVIDESKIIFDLYSLLGKQVGKYTKVVFQGIQFDLGRIKDKRYFVKKAYQLITSRTTPTDSNSVQTRVLLAEWLEKFLKTEFKDTRDFKQKIQRYLEGYEIRKAPVGERIKKLRKKKGWAQKELAKHLGLKSHVTIVNYEKGLRYPPKKVFQWLDEAGM
jgi:ribosome-binding protein aMBF1 (putative translation factor)